MNTGSAIAIIAKEQKKSLRRIAIDAGIPYNTLYAIVRRDSKHANPETIRAVAAVLGVPECTLQPDPKPGKTHRHEFQTTFQEKQLCRTAFAGFLLMTAQDNHGGEKENAQDQYDAWLQHMSDILLHYATLNADGRKELEKRLDELKQLPKYNGRDLSEETIERTKVMAAIQWDERPTTERTT